MSRSLRLWGMPFGEWLTDKHNAGRGIFSLCSQIRFSWGRESLQNSTAVFCFAACVLLSQGILGISSHPRPLQSHVSYSSSLILLFFFSFLFFGVGGGGELMGEYLVGWIYLMRKWLFGTCCLTGQQLCVDFSNWSTTHQTTIRYFNQ